LDATLVNASTLEGIVPQGGGGNINIMSGNGGGNVTKPFEFETQVDKANEDWIIAKCTINVLSSHYQKAYFRVRFRYIDIYNNLASPFAYSNPILVVSKQCLTGTKKKIPFRKNPNPKQPFQLNPHQYPPHNNQSLIRLYHLHL